MLFLDTRQYQLPYTAVISELCKQLKPTKSAFNKESSYEISSKLGKEISGVISYSNHSVFPILDFSCTICPLQVPGYLLTNWLAYLYGRIQSPRPEGRGLCIRLYRYASQLVRSLLPD